LATTVRVVLACGFRYVSARLDWAAEGLRRLARRGDTTRSGLSRQPGSEQKVPARRLPGLGVAVAAVVLALCASAALAQERGDANCDGVVDDGDLRALVERVFAPRDCGDADPNLDGGTSASDFPAEVGLLSITPTPTETPVPEPTVTSTPALGPLVTFLGVAGSGGRLVPISDFTESGLPIINRTAGTGFRIVIEGAPGVTGSAVGQIVMNSKPGDPSAMPDLQVQTTRDLGNASATVCSGGVPAVDPPRFDHEQAIADAINDFACRFSFTTTRNSSCTIDDFETAIFANPASRIQFCRQVGAEDVFGAGDTLVTVRLRDRIGNVGAPAQMIVRLPGSAPTHTVTQTGTATVPPTRTQTGTATETRPATSTPSRTLTVTPTRVPPTPTSTATTGVTATRTPTSAVSPTRTATPTITSAGPTATFTATRPTATRTATVAGPSPTRTATSSGPSATPTRTRTATRPPVTGTATSTPTRTRTVTPTPTPTTLGPRGPAITFIGIVRADNRYNAADLIGTDPSGVPIYRRPLGTGFVIVVEGKRGANNRAVGTSSFNSDGLPNLQIQVNRTLGDGSPEVCDNRAPLIGGVPAIDPPSFAPNQMITDTVNDLACRFVDGEGNSEARARTEACVLFDDGEFDFFDSTSTTQYCSTVIPNAMRFPIGDTLVTVRLSDTNGEVGPVRQMIVRVDR
jgi:hypothetical protein